MRSIFTEKIDKMPSESDKQIIRDALQSGMTYRAIKTAYGFSNDAIRAVARGISKDNKIDEETKIEAINAILKKSQKKKNSRTPNRLLQKYHCSLGN